MTPASSPWQRVGPDVCPNGGDVGGDPQVTDAYNVRYHHRTNETAVVNVYFYGVEGHDGRVCLEQQTEFITCRDRHDPGSTEIWADYAYAYPDTLSYDSADEAAARARKLAEAHGPQAIDWDGEPSWRR